MHQAVSGSILSQRADDSKYQYEDPPRPWWKGTINLYILLAGVIIFWFVFGRGTRYFQLYDDPSSWGVVHIAAAGVAVIVSKPSSCSMFICQL